jgi:hypothetical protein
MRTKYTYKVGENKYIALYTHSVPTLLAYDLSIYGPAFLNSLKSVFVTPFDKIPKAISSHSFSVSPSQRV